MKNGRFTGNGFQASGNVADLHLAAFCLGVGAHELQIVHHDQVQPVIHHQPAAAGTQLPRRQTGGIVDIHFVIGHGGQGPG